MEQNKPKGEKKPLKLKDLTPAMREQYKNHPLFADEKKTKEKKKCDLEELKARKQMKEKSIEERVEEYEIKSTEIKALDKVFKLFCRERQLNRKFAANRSAMNPLNTSSINLNSKHVPQQSQTTQPSQISGSNASSHLNQQISAQQSMNNQQEDSEAQAAMPTYFTGNEVETILHKMGMTLTKSEIDLMIWEIDENLDKRVDNKEFVNMYKRCIMMNSELEPKSLFHMVQFLMYCQPDKFEVTVEDTLELLYVRMGRTNLDKEIIAIFGNDEKTEDGQEKKISFSEYLEKINKRAIEERKEKIISQKEEYSYKKLNEKKEEKH